MTHGRTHARLVVWPRGETSNIASALGEPVVKDAPKKIYRYTIVGLLVTEHPIASLEGVNETVVDVPADEVAAFLETAEQREPRLCIGDATNALLNLGGL